jgi:tRNA(Ile)-lysidine synthase
MSKIKAHIQEFTASFEADTTYYVACSGGVDSMVLLTVLHQLGKTIHVLHVNYHLRGEASDLDQQLIEDFCNQHSIPYSIHSVELSKELENGGNLQDLARNVRYTFFKEKALEIHSKIVLAHHADDQLELFLLNIARKSGVMGLSCMLPEYGRIIRPLLPFSKQEILEFAKKEGIVWREDASNQSNKYRRNSIRNVFLPEIEAQLPEFRESCLYLIEQFQKNQLEVEQKIKIITHKIQHENLLLYTEFDVLTEVEHIELLRQLAIPFGFLKEFKKLRHAENGKRLQLKKAKQLVIRTRTGFKWQLNETND